MRKSIALLLVLVFLTASCIIAPLPVKAGSRTIVVPDDYPTISSAVGNATAGDMIFVKKGIYEGPINQTLVINKTLSLIGEDANNTKINLHPLYTVKWILTQSFSGAADAITIRANDVTLSNFTIVTNGGSISATANGTKILGNKILGSGAITGISIDGYYNTITGNIIENYNSLSVKGSFNVIARNSAKNLSLNITDSSVISNNTCWGITLRSCNLNVISGNKIGGSYSACGIMVARNSSHNLFYANYVSGFAASVAFNSAENNTFYHNNFVNNDVRQVSIYIGPARNFWDYEKEGNFWDDYNGTDANRDGIGDTPYMIDGENVDNYPLMFPFDVENDTVVVLPPEPFPTILVAAAAVMVAVVIVGVLVYFRKRNH
jgi:nitrous oxidase accessory protein